MRIEDRVEALELALSVAVARLAYETHDDPAAFAGFLRTAARGVIADTLENQGKFRACHAALTKIAETLQRYAAAN